MQLVCRMDASRRKRGNTMVFGLKIESEAVPSEGLTGDSASFALIFVKECSDVSAHKSRPKRKTCTKRLSSTSQSFHRAATAAKTVEISPRTRT